MHPIMKNLDDRNLFRGVFEVDQRALVFRKGAKRYDALGTGVSQEIRSTLSSTYLGTESLDKSSRIIFGSKARYLTCCFLGLHVGN